MPGKSPAAREQITNRSQETTMSDLPNDILDRLKKDFPNDEEFESVKKMMLDVQDDTLNVGSPELIRSILVLAAGDVSKVKEIIDSNYCGDPRDVILKAMRARKNQTNDGSAPF